MAFISKIKIDYKNVPRKRMLVALLVILIIIQPITVFANSDTSAPYDLKFSFHGTATAFLEWKFDGQYDYFNVYRSIDGNYQLIGTSDYLWFTDNYLDNSQTYYYKVTAVVSGVESNFSNINRQTPPITVIEVNQKLRVVEIFDNKVVLEHGFNNSPYDLYLDGQLVYTSDSKVVTYEIDNYEFGRVYQFQVETDTGYMTNTVDVILDDSSDRLLSKLDQILNTLVENTFTPSQSVIDNLQDSIDELKNAVGVGAAEKVAGDLGDLNDTSSLDLPISLNSSDDSLPNLSGTETPWSFTIPLTQDQQGNVLSVTLFTQEQLDKLSWLLIVRDVISAFVWILFGYYLINRFTPQFKV